jgi:hypothetical protein
MYVLLLIICILAIAAAAIFFEPVRITFLLDTDRLDMRALARWRPLLGIGAQIVDYRLYLTVRLFGWKIWSGFRKKGAGNGARGSLLKSMALSDTRVRISCGLSQPHVTGIFCAAVDFAGALISNVGIELEPEFVPDREFIRIRAVTSLNIGKTLVNLIKPKSNRARRRKIYGSAEPE